MKNQFRYGMLVLLLSAGTMLTAQCAFEGFTYAGQYNGHVYYVSTGNMSWTTANATATNLGGYLASIADAAENAFVADIAFAYADDPGETDPGAWIGYNDIASEGTFVWTNGEPVTYDNWYAGEPNNGEYGDGLGEDFTEINRGALGAWNDLPAFVNYIEAVIEFNDDDCDGVANVCDEVFNDADCDGIGDGCDNFSADSDCDGVPDDCDNCDGGDDNGPCDADLFPGLSNLPANWICHANDRKVFMCHDGNTICVDFHAVQAHLDHGDFLGPCTGCEDQGFYAPIENNIPSSAAIREFAVYPNPSNGDITINMDQHRGTIRIYDQRGQMIRSMDGTAFQQLAITLQEAGVYIIQLTTETETIAKRVTVTR